MYTMIFDCEYSYYLSQAHTLFEAWNVLATVSNCPNAKPPTLHYPDVRVSQFYLYISKGALLMSPDTTPH